MFLKRFLMLLLLSTVPFFGCTEKPDAPSIPPEEAEPISLQPLTPVANREKKTFALLRAKFPGSLLDKDFKTLKAVANSLTYRTYVKNTERYTKSFRTFEEFLNTTPPDAKSLLLPLFREHLQHTPNAEEIAIFYQIVVLFESFAITHSIGRFVEALHEKFHRLYDDPIAIAMTAKDPRKFIIFEDAYQDLAKKNSESAKERIQERFQEHGQDEGLLWLAVEEPRTFGLIISTFVHLTTNDFLSWVNSNK